MNDKPRGEVEFLEAARAELERDCEGLDGHTRSRLRYVRHQALERASVRRFNLLTPFGGLVTACVLVLAVIVLDPMRAPESVEPVLPVEDLEILVSGELEFYEDFEFYQWLADNGGARG